MQDSRDFARLPLGSLIVRCALPAMVSMSAMALYSVIDGVFVGYFLGASALAAINLVFPMFMLFSSVIDMLAAGSSVQIATRLGAGKRREASRIFSFSLGAIFVVSHRHELLRALPPDDGRAACQTPLGPGLYLRGPAGRCQVAQSR